jgi:hypothetical protein
VASSAEPGYEGSAFLVTWRPDTRQTLLEHLGETQFQQTREGGRALSSDEAIAETSTLATVAVNTASIAGAAPPCKAGMTWLYVSSVSTMVECPSISVTNLTCTPFARLLPLRIPN